MALTLEQTEAIKRAVEAGLGLGCVSRIALEDAFERGTLKACRVPHRDFRRQFYFLLHKRKRRGAGVEQLAVALPLDGLTATSRLVGRPAHGNRPTLREIHPLAAHLDSIAFGGSEIEQSSPPIDDHVAHRGPFPPLA